MTGKKILLLIHSLSMGGAERVATNLANHWANKGHRVGVATLSEAASDFYMLDPGVERMPLDAAATSSHALAAVANNLKVLRKVRRLLRTWQPDIAIGMMPTANIYIALAGNGLPLRRIGSEHSHPPRLPLGHIWETLRKFGYGFLDSVVALTQPSAEWLRAHTGVKSVAVIGNPIPWPLPSHPPVRDPLELIPPNRKICLAVGRLSPEKGFDLLISAFSRIAHAFPDWDLVIVGEGGLRASLENQIRELQLAGRVHLPGKAGNIGDWYAAGHLYVMSSRFEGFGNTLAEAMAHGLPAISFDCETGPSDIIRHERDGLLVPPGDIAALSDGMARIMRDERLRTTFARDAIEARERFSLERAADAWEGLF